jgi:hypothetical protein
MTLVHYVYIGLLNFLLFMIFWIVTRHHKGFNRHILFGMILMWLVLFHFSIEAAVALSVRQDDTFVPFVIFYCAGYIAMFLWSFCRDWLWRIRQSNLVVPERQFVRCPKKIDLIPKED